LSKTENTEDESYFELKKTRKTKGNENRIMKNDGILLKKERNEDKDKEVLVLLEEFKKLKCC